MGHIRQYTNLLPQPVRFGLRKFMFRGSAHTCPLCENRISGFHDHGGGHDVLDTRKVVGGMRRIKDRCPVCHGCDRTRMMMTYLEKVVDVHNNPKSILHIAPDYGLYLWLKRQPNVTYTGSDIDAGRYRHIENMQSADLMDAPFADNSFDIVICSHVLEHVPDDAKAFKEILRILKPGGEAMLLVPLATDGKPTEEEPSISDPAEQERRFGQWDHVRIYSKDDFLDRMRVAGFDVAPFEPFVTMPETAEERMLNPLEILPIGKKPL